MSFANFFSKVANAVVAVGEEIAVKTYETLKPAVEYFSGTHAVVKSSGSTPKSGGAGAVVHKPQKQTKPAAKLSKIAAAYKAKANVASAAPVGTTCQTCSGTAPKSTSYSAQEFVAFEKMMADPQVEGRRNDVYLDSLGKPTVGIGHLVLPGDNLKVGDIISDEQVENLFKNDASWALTAAKSQAAEANISDNAFIPYLASVNFQLGPTWGPSKEPKTWQLILDGKYADAAKSLDGTKWANQTPVRVKTFQDALLNLPPKRPNTSSP